MDPVGAVLGGGIALFGGQDGSSELMEQAIGDAIVSAGVVVGSQIMSQILQNFAESNAELES